MLIVIQLLFNRLALGRMEARPTLFDFAIRVYNGELEDNEINRPHIFNVLYSVMAIYFKELEAGAAST